jgi:hypothetical protein
MTKKAPSPAKSSGLPIPLAQANGYYRAEDEQRVQTLIQALLDGRRPIALSCASTDTLDHYSRLLVRDLRQHAHVQVLAHRPGSCDKLVQQINDLLADVPLADVIARDNAPAPRIHVFVVHDSPTLSTGEFALLVRLVNDLPGANLRIALIQDRDFAVTGNLQALGAQALHWRIQVPGMPPSGSSETSREALRDALREAPETLPPWARAPNDPPVRRRWRLAFWRRPAPREATPTAPTRPLTKPASAARGAVTRPPSKAAQAAARVRAENSAARRNRTVLISGVLLSAALAGMLGTWLSIQPSAVRASKPMVPTTTTNPAPTTTTAAIALRTRP